MHILNDQAIFDAALARMLTQSDQGKPIITPEAPVIHQPVLVKAPEQRVTADGAYITRMEYRMEYPANVMWSTHNRNHIGWRHSQQEVTVDLSLLFLEPPDQFFEAAKTGRMVRMVFSGDD